MSGTPTQATKHSATYEAHRRAEIIRRYVALDSPTLRDDERFAEELGLTRDSLYRLAKSWRLLGDAAPLSGSQARTSAADRRAAIVAAADPDLSRVNPTRRPLIRRRLEALRCFLQIEQPTAEDELRSASAIGMSLDAFRRLHRIWLLTRDPASLPGGSTPARTPKRRAPALCAEQERSIEEAVAELGAEASSTQVHRAVADRCRRAGLRVPDQSTVYHRFVEARARLAYPRADAGFAIDHSALELPVITDRGVQLPVFSAIIALQSGRIVTHELSLDPPDAKRAGSLLARSLRNAPIEKVVPLHLGAPKDRDWDDLLAALALGGVHVRQGPTRSLRPGHFLIRTSGTRLGRLKLRPRIAMRPRDVPIRRMGRGSVPLELPEAVEVVDEIVARINSGGGGADPTWVAGDNRDEVRRSLEALASRP